MSYLFKMHLQDSDDKRLTTAVTVAVIAVVVVVVVGVVFVLCDFLPNGIHSGRKIVGEMEWRRRFGRWISCFRKSARRK